MSTILVFLFLFIGNTHEAKGDGIPHEEEIKAMIQLYVANSLSTDLEEIRVRRVLPANGRAFPWSGKVKSLRAGSQGKLLGRVLFVLSVEENERETVSRWVTADIEKIENVVVTSRSLKRHHVLEAGDLLLRSISVTHQRNRHVRHLETLIGLRLTRSTGKGVPIRADLVEESPLILRGERVMLLLESKGLHIMTLGKAKEDGFLGKIIGVQNLDSRKIVYGKVVESGIVKIFFTTTR